jgi:transposase
MRRVELIELIRREAREGASIRSLSRKYGVHRRVVRDALRSAVPPEPKRPERPHPAITTEVRAFIEDALTADKKAPRKQRHTARRIWQRIGAELGASVAESTIRSYVADRRRELGIGLQAYVPQHHEEGAQAEVDFYEAAVDFPWGRQDAQVIAVRSEASAAARHRAYPAQTQAAFFDGIAHGLSFHGGVFPVMRFDNLPLAVAKVLRGRRRTEQDRFIAFRSHYGFESSFTTPGIQGAHEKGGVEGEAGRFRRRWFTPVPAVEGWEDLDDYLLDACVGELDRRAPGRGELVRDVAARERSLLLPLPEEPFDLSLVSRCRVDTKSRVQVLTNRYSVPVRLVGREVEVRITPMQVEVAHGGKVVARHPRAYLRYAERLELDHYLELLVERPGAFPGSLALHQERGRGAFTAHHQALWDRFKDRWGERDGTRHMIEVLLLRRIHPAPVHAEAVEAALRLGVSDSRAVALLCRHLSDATKPGAAPIEVGELSRYDRPLPDVAAYDLLLGETP